MVNIHEVSECVAISCERSESAASCEGGRVSDGGDGNENHRRLTVELYE